MWRRIAWFAFLSNLLLSFTARAEELSATLDKIHSYNLVSIHELFYKNDFLNLWNNADAYSDEAILYLENGNNNNIKKRILIIAMQNMKKDKFIKFCYYAIDIAKTGSLQKELLFELIFRNARIVDLEDQSIVFLLQKLRKVTLKIEHILTMFWQGMRRQKIGSQDFALVDIGP